jgi:hypothetical protein
MREISSPPAAVVKYSMELIIKCEIDGDKFLYFKILCRKRDGSGGCLWAECRLFIMMTKFMLWKRVWK